MFSPKNLCIFLLPWKYPLPATCFLFFNWPLSSCLISVSSKIKRPPDNREARGIISFGQRLVEGKCFLWSPRQEAINASRITWTCLADEFIYFLFFCFLGVPEAEVTWFRNKSKLGSSHHLHEGSLLLTDVSSSDQGLYSCRAANVHGELTENTQLLILGKPLQAGYPWWAPLGVTHSPSTSSFPWSKYIHKDKINIPPLLPTLGPSSRKNTNFGARQTLVWTLALLLTHYVTLGKLLHLAKFRCWSCVETCKTRIARIGGWGQG